MLARIQISTREVACLPPEVPNTITGTIPREFPTRNQRLIHLKSRVRRHQRGYSQHWNHVCTALFYRCMYSNPQGSSIILRLHKSHTRISAQLQQRHRHTSRVSSLNSNTHNFPNDNDNSHRVFRWNYPLFSAVIISLDFAQSTYSEWFGGVFLR